MDEAQTITTEATPSCTCRTPSGSNRAVKWTTAGGMLTALGVCAACCLLPFVLLSLGVAGAWVSTLDALAAYKWIFIPLTTALLGYGFYVAYWKPRRSCTVGTSCKTCGSPRYVRIGLWIATVLAISGIVFERIEPMLVASQ
jgi:mercuric ion transport protein